MTLEKLAIDYGSADGHLEGSLTVLFNPTQLKFIRTVQWKNENPARPDTLTSLRYEGRTPPTLGLDLFFDTYDAPVASASSWLGSLIPTSSVMRNDPSSVLEQTSMLEQLTRVDRETHEPPTCTLRWGRNVLFYGVLSHAETTVTMFLDDGTPVRATVSCSFTARETNTAGETNAAGETNEGSADELHSADVIKKYTVKPGDTLTLIASRLYQDPRRWRPIAEANLLEDPLSLTPGRILLIPKLQG